MQSLADLYAQPFVVIGPDLRVRLVNRAFEEVYGIAREQAVGRPCYEFLHAGGKRPCPCGPDGSHCPFRDVFSGATAQVSVSTYLDEGGVERLVRIQGHPLKTAAGGIMLGELIQVDEPADAVASTDTPESDPGLRMVGGSGLFRQILGKLRLAAASKAPVLLEGATGTGKELAAGYIHRHSDRAGGPFVTLDCTTLGKDLFESEVFGHERGAFTGSAGKRQGLFERAHRGTLFLDEIGEMPLPLQAKLLRVLESGEFRRVGSDVTHKADVRIVCASNRDLRDTNGFRQDLYFRIACIRVRMPSLAERAEDIPVLARELLLRIGATSQRSYRLGSDALALLRSHPFPGNIRELRNVLWVAAVHSDNGRISAEQIALALQVEPVVNGSGQPQAMAVPGQAPPPTAAPVTLKDLEACHMRDLLAAHGGNRRAAAAALQISERTLYRKLRRYGLS
jgi:DNA-binding NtrC family response regulator